MTFTYQSKCMSTETPVAVVKMLSCVSAFRKVEVEDDVALIRYSRFVLEFAYLW